jgi:flagellar motor switch protein FliG
MGSGKSVVITVYGHGGVIDKIAVSLFDKPESDYYDYNNESNAKTYRDTINNLELPGEAWVSAKIISENTQYALDTFLPLKFDIILQLDDRAIQKMLTKLDSRELVKALKGENEIIQEKIFNTMSKRTVQILKEDMEYAGPIRKQDVKEAQEKILNIIRRLEQAGELIIPHSNGETIE